MDDPFVFRSLLFAAIEYGLALYVFTRGRSYQKPFGMALILLATYQLGEFIFLFFDQSWALQLSIIATTFLPPIGVYLVSMKTKHNRYFWFTMGVGAILGFVMFLNPGIFEGAGQTFCLVKFLTLAGQHELVFAWGIYYNVTLIITSIWALKNAFTSKDKEFRRMNTLFFFALMSFFPAAFLIVTISPEFEFTDLTSVMCALAIIAAFIMAWTSRYVKEPKIHA